MGTLTGDGMDTTTRVPARDLHRAARVALGTSETALALMRPILEQKAAELARARGAQHVETLSAENDLALSSLGDGEDQAAVDHLKRLAGECAALLGPDHPDTLVVRGNLAVARLAAGFPRDACAELADVAARRARVLGEDHRSTLNALLALALAHLGAGRTDTAAGLLDAVLDAAVARHGERDRLADTCRALLAHRSAA